MFAWFKTMLFGAPKPAPTPDDAPVSRETESVATEPEAPPPPPPPELTVDGPLRALHAAMANFEREARAPQWADTPELAPVRLDRLRAALCDAAAARLRRLREAVATGDPSRVEEWLRADLAPYLDQLSGHLSDATEAALAGSPAAVALRDRLHRLLFIEIDAAAREAGLFRVQPIEVFETTFDPELHSAAGRRDASGRPGGIVRLVEIGRLDPAGRRLLTPARVIVGD